MVDHAGEWCTGYLDVNGLPLQRLHGNVHVDPFLDALAPGTDGQDYGVRVYGPERGVQALDSSTLRPESRDLAVANSDAEGLGGLREGESQPVGVHLCLPADVDAADGILSYAGLKLSQVRLREPGRCGTVKHLGESFLELRLFVVRAGDFHPGEVPVLCIDLGKLFYLGDDLLMALAALLDETGKGLRGSGLFQRNQQAGCGPRGLAPYGLPFDYGALDAQLSEMIGDGAADYSTTGYQHVG